MTRYRLGVLLHHPIHYLAPLMREAARDAEIDLRVYYCYDHGVSERFDPELRVQYRWDIPLLDGYKHEFLKNWSPWNSTAPIKGVFNPGIWTAVRRERFDAFIVHGYVSPTVWLAILAAKSVGTRVFLRGESTLMYPRSAAVMQFKNTMLRGIFSLVDCFLTIGTRNAEFYRSFGIPDDRMVLTPYSVDNESFFAHRRRNPDEGQSLRRSLGIAPDDPVILFVGKLLDRKRPADLLDAYSQLVREFPRATLLFVGEGAQRAELEARVRERGLQRVYFAGFKNRGDILAYYAAGDMFVLPSIHETFGLVVNEAMCFALPVVVSDLVGSSADLVRPENGFVIPARDVSAIAGALRPLLADPATRRAMGAASEARIRRWSYVECVAGFKTALHRTVRSAPTVTGAPQKANV